MSLNSRIIIIHGTEGSPESNWFPWLKDELEKISHNVLCPAFPTPENQSLNSWSDTLNSQVIELTDNDILIGHSTGVIFILNILNKLSQPIKATFLVAGFASRIGIDKYDQLNSTFLSPKLDWDKIKNNAGNLFIYSGSNDPYVPRNCGIELADNLGVEEIIMPNGGHLNAESGFIRFDDLLSNIRAI